mgnify:CR=1 FL=1
MVFKCEFKIVNTEIKYSIEIPLITELTTVLDVINIIKKDIENKFQIQTNFDIIESERGEDGVSVQDSGARASDIFQPLKVFYIRPIIHSFDQHEHEHQHEHEEEGCECPICYDMISRRNVENSLFFQCQHFICAACHGNLLNRICPICRAEPRIENNNILNENINNYRYFQNMRDNNNQVNNIHHNNNNYHDNIFHNNIQHNNNVVEFVI